MEILKSITPELNVIEKMFKTGRYVGKLVDQPLLQGLGDLRHPIWFLYGVRDLGKIASSGKSRSASDRFHHLLLGSFRSLFMIAFVSRQLQRVSSAPILRTLAQTSRLTPGFVLYFSTRSLWNLGMQNDPKSWLSRIDDGCEIVSTLLEDILHRHPTVGAAFGLASASACLAQKSILLWEKYSFTS